MSAAALGAADANRLRLGRFLLYSALGHVGLVGFLLFSPGPEILAPKGVIAVDLTVGLPAPAAAPSKPKAAPKPAPKKAEATPKAKPAPPPPPPPKKTKATVLPKDSQRQPEKKPPPKQAAPARKELEPEEVPKQEQVSYEDMLEQMRSEAGEEKPSPAESDAPESPQAAGSQLPIGDPNGAPVSPEVAAWMRKVKIHVQRVWRAPAQFSSDRLVAFLEVELDSAGNVVGAARMLRGSGNPWYDEEAQRALKRANPLPAPPRPGRYSIAFDSQE